MNITHQLTCIFCEIDDFCKEIDNYIQDKLLMGPTKSARGPSCQLAISEMMTILVMFHMIRFKDFKTFYTGFLSPYWKNYFPQMPCYERFVQIMKRAIFPLTLFTQLKGGKRTGIYYIDSSCLPVCHLKRSRRHKTFDELAHYGHTSTGWFFGLKLHMVTNHERELIAFKITQGHRNDSKIAANLLLALQGLAFGDKGYISQKLFDELFSKGLKLITRQRKNMPQKVLALPQIRGHINES